MSIVNIGIVAHVDAGKTSLTERILFETKVIAKIGRVDHGDTQTDSLALERRRGITIKASVVSFFVEEQKINLIDTPGHADFIAEVERSFGVLDGAILVVSAVEGIQAQTKFLMSVLRNLAIPTIIFINKIDRVGAQSHELVAQIQETLAPSVLPLNRPEQIGTREVSVVANEFTSSECAGDEFDGDEFANSPDYSFREACIELLTQHDEPLLEAYIQDEPITQARLVASLTQQCRSAKLYPILFGSAMLGIGVTELLTAIRTFFPNSSKRKSDGKSEAEVEVETLSAVVFKIERESTGEKIAYVRIFSGAIQVRTDVPVRRRSQDGSFATTISKVKKLHLFHAGKSVQASLAPGGDFCKVWGLNDVKIGDIVGEWSEDIRHLHLVSPQLESRIEAQTPEENHALYQALMELAEEDPLINLTKDAFHNELYLRIFGEVQKEVLEAMLQEKYGLAVRFAESRVVCIEKPMGIGEAAEEMGKGENPFAATVGFRVEAGQPGSGISYALEVQLGSLPLPLHRAIEETVYETLKQGIYGWEVRDVAVTLTHSGYSSVGSTAGDFRLLVPLVLMQALVQAGTQVYEPLNDFELHGPTHALSHGMFQLTLAQAIFEQPTLHGDNFRLTGTLPVATTEEFKRELLTYTEGQGMLTTKPGGFRRIDGEILPTRKRADNNPLDRKEYLFNVGR